MAAVTHGGNLFAAARAVGRDWRCMLEFSASINPLGPSPSVREAILDSMDRIAFYPDPDAVQLREALAQHWNVDPECILPGNGATELIHFLARVWPQPRPGLVIPAFSEFHRAYPEAALVRPGERWPEQGLLIYTNPTTPAGELAERVERAGLTLVDESFLEFTGQPSRIGSGDIVLRSLTKFHALPGLRIGALVAPVDLCRAWRRHREPWQVNALAEAAALAAIGDTEHAARTRAFVDTERARLLRGLRGIAGVHPAPSRANYILVRLDYAASALCQFMLSNGILLRNCAGWPGVEGEAVRIAVRPTADNDRLLNVWSQFPCA